MSSVEPQTPYNEYPNVNGVTTVFPYEFQLLAASDLIVTVDGVVVPTSEFILTGIGVQSGGDVTFNTAPLAGTTVLLSREIDLRRDTDYQYNGDLKENTVDNDFNRLWQALQGFFAIMGGAVRAPFPEQLTELPDAATRAGNVPVFDLAGNPTVMVPASGSAADVLLRLANPAFGDALMAVQQPIPNAPARTQHDKNADPTAITVQDRGMSTSATTGYNAAALNDLLTYAITNGLEYLYIDKDYTLDGTVLTPKRSQVMVRGPGKLINLYRKWPGSELLPPFQPSNDINPSNHLRALARTATPVVVTMGDSISSEGPDSLARTQNQWSVIKERFLACNPGKTFTFHNRAIGGQTWLNANSVPTAFPSWYTVTTTPWLDYLQALSPDVVVLAFGMNDANGFNAGALVAVVNKILAWTKVPDIVFVTNLVPALASIYPDGIGTGFTQEVFQEGRDYAAGFARTFARQQGYGLIDLNRMMVAARDGYDVQAGVMRLVETVAASAYTATQPAKDFAFSGTATGAAWSEGRVLKVKCGLGTQDFIFVTKTGGNFVVSGFTEALSTYKTIATGVAVPAGTFDMEIGAYGDVARLLVDTSGSGIGKTVIAEFQVVRHGGTHSPQVEWQDAAGTGPFTSISYLSGYGDPKFRQTVTDADMWGQSTITADAKVPYGGNGINHPSAKGIERVIRPVVEAADLRANVGFGIIEAGASNGGNWAKYADGTAVFTKKVNITGSISAVSGSIFVQAAPQADADFPAIFASDGAGGFKFNASFSVMTAAASFVWVLANGSSKVNNLIRYRLAASTSIAAVDADVYITLNGRWI